MEVNWDLYRIFYYVCEFKNLTKVANYFYVSQPAITKKIKALENELGINLIKSNNKGITITDEGKALYEEIKPACEILNNIDSKYLDSTDVKKTIVVSGGYMTIDKVIMPIIIRYKDKHPEIQFRVETCSFEESVKKLRSGEIDLFFYGHDRITDDTDNLVIKECYKIKNRFVVSSKIRNQYPDKISIYDINDYPIIIKDNTGRSRMILEQELEKKGVTLKPKYEVPTYLAIKGLIESNSGIGYLNADYIDDDIKSGNLVVIPTVEELPQISIYCAYLKNNNNKSAIKEFVDVVKERNNKSLF
ncbi:MAG: LysR family transcriptional regulator [Clostridia bacterium]|nr:LysR family transcriptional regulator [Clostridia bacterium]